MVRNGWTRVTIGCALALITLWSSATAAQQPLDLFGEPASVPAQDAAQDAGVVRARYVAVDFGDLAAAASTREQLTLNLFGDASFRAVIDAVEPQGDAGSTVIGHLDGIANSSVILVTVDGVMAGSITMPGAQYQIRYVGEGVHAVREFDATKMPTELEPLVPDASMVEAAPADPQVAADTGTRFDLMVVYTGAARAAAGGTAAMQALINLGVTETNQAYANSGIVPRLRLVHMSEIAYAESGTLGTDLPRLRGNGDGFLDTVHALRNTYGADMVKLVVNAASDGCGLAYLMGPGHNVAFAVNAFSVTARSCISPNYTFGHELGHNMGSNHAPDDPVGTGAYNYSYGHKVPTQFRTVMAYADNCAAPCPRVLNFSNPNVSRNGFPTGTATRNNALSINNVRTSVANWRTQVPLVQVNQLWPVYQSGTATPPQAGRSARFWALVRNIGPNPLSAGQRVYFLMETTGGASDTWIGSVSIAGLAPGASAWYALDYTIPPNRSGAWQYWAITWDTAASEYTSSWRGPQAFNITPAPTYSANVNQLWPVSGAQGGRTVTLWANIWNNGAAALPADARVWFYVTGPGYASWVGNAVVTGLASNATAWYSFNWTIPSNVAAGAYQYRASVWRSGTTLISNTGGPQNFTMLAAPAVGANVDQLWPIYNGLPGAAVTMWARVRNTGTAALPGTARVYYWLNGEVGSTSVAGLAPNASAWYSFNYVIPAGWTGGIYSYWAQARNGATVLSPWAGPQRFTIGFNTQFTGSNVPWVAVRGTWTNNSGAFYYTAGIASQWSSSSYSTSSFTNVDYSARFWRNGDALASCLAIRGTPGTQTAIGEWQHGYMFCYTRDGRYAVWKRVNHVWTALQNYVATATVVQGSAWNLLRVRAVGTSMTFWINGTQVWTGNDSSLSSGRVALWMYGTGPLWIDYATLNSANAVPDEMAEAASSADAALDGPPGESAPAAMADEGGVSAEQQALNDAANKDVGEPTGATGASGDRLPDRRPPSQ